MAGENQLPRVVLITHVLTMMCMCAHVHVHTTYIHTNSDNKRLRHVQKPRRLGAVQNNSNWKHRHSSNQYLGKFELKIF